MKELRPPGPAEETAIVIRCGALEVTGLLNTTASALAVASALPFVSQAGRFGDELFFEIPVHSKLAEDAKEIVGRGDIGYWPPGRAFCVFWGPTPASTGNEIRAASKVSIIGHVTGDPELLSVIRDGEMVRVEKA